MWRLSRFIVAGLLPASLLSSGGPAAATNEPEFLWRTRATYSADLRVFPRWTGILEMYARSRAQIIPTCERTVFNFCNLQDWKAKLKEWQNEPPEVQLNLVNRYLNPYRYVDDPTNWRMNDYWETPQQFLKKFGDCEDYAIIKYLSLRELGWSVEDLRIVILNDWNLIDRKTGRPIGHAVLIVNLNGKRFVLDNLTTLATDIDRVTHYQPVFSLNEKGYWVHRKINRSHRYNR